MAYKKFDDPTATVSQAPSKIYTAFPDAAQRAALRGMFNRIVANCYDTLVQGTSATALASSCGTGSTCGVKVRNAVMALVDGIYGSIAAQDNIFLPAGTQGANTVVKYLISNNLVGTAGTITAGNEAASTAGAYLPDLPAGHVPLGYFTFATGTASIWPRVTSGAHSVLSGAGNTSGTAAFTDLASMPFTEEE